MVDIWKFVNAKKVKITDIDGKEYEGNVVSVFDKEETGEDEDDITIDVGKDNYLCFTPSEIKEISVVE